MNDHQAIVRDQVRITALEDSVALLTRQVAALEAQVDYLKKIARVGGDRTPARIQMGALTARDYLMDRGITSGHVSAADLGFEALDVFRAQRRGTPDREEGGGSYVYPIEVLDEALRRVQSEGRNPMFRPL